MKEKFDFNEIVKIAPKNKDKAESLKVHLGYITGKSQNEDTGEYGYSVALQETHENWFFYEDELESTGKFLEKENVDYGSVRIKVDESGNGTFGTTYTSLDEIQEAIKTNQVIKASGYMLEVGMVSDDLEGIYKLIDLSCRHSDVTIRKASFDLLLRIFIRFKDKVSLNVVLKMICLGKNDPDPNITKIVKGLLEILQIVDYDMWYKLR